MNVGIAIGLIAIACTILLVLAEHERRQRRRRMGLPTTITVDDGSMFPDDRWTTVAVEDELIRAPSPATAEVSAERPCRLCQGRGFLLPNGAGCGVCEGRGTVQVSRGWLDDVPRRYRIPERREREPMNQTERSSR